MRQINLATFLFFATVLLGCGTTIKPGQMGLKYIVLDEPALQEETRPEGWYFQWWWNDMVAYDVTWKSRDENVEVLTADDLHVPTTATVTYRPDPKKLHDLHIQIGPDYYEEVIAPAFVTLLRSEFANYKHNDLARESPKIEQEVLSKLRATLKGKPLEIDQVAIAHIQYDKDVTKSISQKLVMEQEAERKTFELEIAKQDAEIARTNAQGRGDAIRIQADGEAQAIVIKAKAQAEAQDSVTKTLTTEYLQYKAFDGTATRYYFVPIGKDGLPLIINAESGPVPGPRR